MRLTFIGWSKDERRQVKIADINMRKGEKVIIGGIEVFETIDTISVEDTTQYIPENELETLKNKIRQEAEEEITREIIDALGNVIPFGDIEDIVRELRSDTDGCEY
jgi:hypothetical protein